MKNFTLTAGKLVTTVAALVSGLLLCLPWNHDGENLFVISASLRDSSDNSLWGWLLLFAVILLLALWACTILASLFSSASAGKLNSTTMGLSILLSLTFLVVWLFSEGSFEVFRDDITLYPWLLIVTAVASYYGAHMDQQTVGAANSSKAINYDTVQPHQRCPHCGALLEADARFCNNCGGRI